MKSITRLVLAMAAAATVLLAPAAKADPTGLVAPGTEVYKYQQGSLAGTLSIRDLGPRPWSTPQTPSRHIAVTLNLNGALYTGDGTSWPAYDGARVFFSLRGDFSPVYHYQGWINRVTRTGGGTFKQAGQPDSSARPWFVFPHPLGPVM
jgi:hypothetical protein